MNEREIKGLGILLGVGALAMLVIGQAYQAGVAAGLARGVDGTRGYVGGHGFFPFPPFLLIIGGVVLFVVWKRRWAGDGNGHPGRGPGGGRPPRLFEEWHRRAHEAGAEPERPATGEHRPEGGAAESRNEPTTV